MIVTDRAVGRSSTGPVRSRYVSVCEKVTDDVRLSAKPS